MSNLSRAKQRNQLSNKEARELANRARLVRIHAQGLKAGTVLRYSDRSYIMQSDGSLRRV